MRFNFAEEVKDKRGHYQGHFNAANRLILGWSLSIETEVSILPRISLLLYQIKLGFNRV